MVCLEPKLLARQGRLIDGVGAVRQTVTAGRLSHVVGHDPEDEVRLPRVADGRQVVGDREEPRRAPVLDQL